MIRSLSFENLQKTSEAVETSLPSGPYWDDVILEYSEGLRLPLNTEKNRVIALTSFPFESTQNMKFERRQGSDISAFVFQKNLKNTYLTSEGIGKSVFLSFLSFYECHPLKIVTHKTKDLVDFYRKEYFEDFARRLAEIEKQSFSILNLLFLGNLYGLFDHLPRFLKNYESVDSAEKVVLVFSPLEQIAFKKKWKESMKCRFIHLGLDAKFYQEDAQRGENDVTIVRDIVLETQREEKELKKLGKLISSGDATSLHIVWDCEVFASDYFPGKHFYFRMFLVTMLISFFYKKIIYFYSLF